jgi:hypothetical protein
MLANAVEDLGLAGLEYVLQSLGIHDQHMMDKLKQAMHQLGASPGVVRDVVWNIYTQGEHFLTQEVQKLIDPIHYSMNQFNAQLLPDQDFHTSQTQSCLAILTNLRDAQGANTLMTPRTDVVFQNIVPLTTLHQTIQKNDQLVLGTSHQVTQQPLISGGEMASIVAGAALGAIILGMGLILAVPSAGASAVIAVGIAGAIAGACIGDIVYRLVVNVIVPLFELLVQASNYIQTTLQDLEIALLVWIAERVIVSSVARLTPAQQDQKVDEALKKMIENLRKFLESILGIELLSAITKQLICMGLDPDDVTRFLQELTQQLIIDNVTNVTYANPFEIKGITKGGENVLSFLKRISKQNPPSLADARLFKAILSIGPENIAGINVEFHLPNGMTGDADIIDKRGNIYEVGGAAQKASIFKEQNPKYAELLKYTKGTDIYLCADGDDDAINRLRRFFQEGYSKATQPRNPNDPYVGNTNKDFKSVKEVRQTIPAPYRC